MNDHKEEILLQSLFFRDKRSPKYKITIRGNFFTKCAFYKPYILWKIKFYTLTDARKFMSWLSSHQQLLLKNTKNSLSMKFKCGISRFLLNGIHKFSIPCNDFLFIHPFIAIVHNLSSCLSFCYYDIIWPNNANKWRRWFVRRTYKAFYFHFSCEFVLCSHSYFIISHDQTNNSPFTKWSRWWYHDEKPSSLFCVKNTQQIE